MRFTFIFADILLPNGISSQACQVTVDKKSGSIRWLRQASH